MAPATGDAARTLLHVVMLVMRTVAADMRRSPKPLAPTQMGSLMRIAAGACSMSELARYQAVSLPTISKSVDMLVRRGWVERWVDKQDRRQTMARLTPSGRRVLAHIRQRTETQVALTLAPLTTAERTQLVAALNVLTRVLVVPGDDGCALPKISPKGESNEGSENEDRGLARRRPRADARRRSRPRRRRGREVDRLARHPDGRR